MKAGRFISNYLKAKDIEKPETVTVASVEAVSFKDDNGGDRESLVVYFEELDQGVVTSKTSLAQLVEIFESDETDEWIGKPVVMFNDATVQFKGKRVGGIRFRAVA